MGMKMDMEKEGVLVVWLDGYMYGGMMWPCKGGKKWSTWRGVERENVLRKKMSKLGIGG